MLMAARLDRNDTLRDRGAGSVIPACVTSPEGRVTDTHGDLPPIVREE